jgi:hypothetical protein
VITVLGKFRRREETSGYTEVVREGAVVVVHKCAHSWNSPPAACG